MISLFILNPKRKKVIVLYSETIFHSQNPLSQNMIFIFIFVSTWTHIKNHTHNRVVFKMRRNFRKKKKEATNEWHEVCVKGEKKEWKKCKKKIKIMKKIWTKWKRKGKRRLEKQTKGAKGAKGSLAQAAKYVVL